MSSRKGEDVSKKRKGRGKVLHPNARIMGSRGGHGGMLADGRSYWIPREPLANHLLVYNDFSKPMDVNGPSAPDYGRKPGCEFKHTIIGAEFLKGPMLNEPSAPDYGQRPGGGSKHTITIRSSGLVHRIWPEPCRASTFIFVHGKESACIVSRGPVEDKEEADHELRLAFGGLADRRMKRCGTFGPASKGHVDVEPYAVVSLVLNPDNHGEEFKPDSSPKDPGPRSVYDKAAIQLLKDKLENGTINETIQTAISALQRLYRENVKAHEIRVYAFQDNKEDFLAREEIERHLTAINNV